MRKLAVISILVMATTFVALYFLYLFFVNQVTDIGPQLQYQVSSQQIDSTASSSSSPSSAIGSSSSPGSSAPGNVQESKQLKPIVL